MTVISLLWNLH